MPSSLDLLLDEHVGRVFQSVLQERGFDVVQAKDVTGEETDDRELLNYCRENHRTLVTNDVKDFLELHHRASHSGIILYPSQRLLNDDPEGVARTVEEIAEQYGSDGLKDEVVFLDTWYRWLKER